MLIGGGGGEARKYNHTLFEPLQNCVALDDKSLCFMQNFEQYQRVLKTIPFLTHTFVAPHQENHVSLLLWTHTHKHEQLLITVKLRRGINVGFTNISLGLGIEPGTSA